MLMLCIYIYMPIVSQDILSVFILKSSKLFHVIEYHRTGAVQMCHLIILIMCIKKVWQTHLLTKQYRNTI